MSYFSRVRHSWLKAFALAFSLACLASVAAAQEFRADPFDEKIRVLHGGKAQRWVTDRAAYATDKAIFDEYFQKYFFPAMTRNSPSELADLGKLRVDLFKKFLWNTTNEELQSNLTRMAYAHSLRVAANLEKMPPEPVVADPPYHPAVRYNAILVVGLLDEQYAIDGGANSRPPKPFPPATKALTSIVDRATTSNQFPPPVILGAIIGLERHAKYRDALPAGAADAISAALLKLVTHDKPIQELDPAAYAWLRMRAAGALAQLGSLGPNNAAHDALIKLMNDSKNLDDRCAAAALLGKFKYDGAKIDAPAATDALFKLAHDLGVEEFKRATDFEKLRITGGGSVVSADPNAPELDLYPRRHVLTRLVELGAGLGAVKPAIPEDGRKNVDAILAAIKPVITAAANDDTGSLAVADAVRKMVDAINAVAPGEEPASDEVSVESPPAEPAGAPAPVPAGAPAAAETPPAETPAAAAADTETPPAEAPAAEPAAQPEDAMN